MEDERLLKIAERLQSYMSEHKVADLLDADTMKVAQLVCSEQVLYSIAAIVGMKLSAINLFVFGMIYQAARSGDTNFEDLLKGIKGL